MQRMPAGEVLCIGTPLERLASTPKGQLSSPYPDFASAAEEGHRKYMAAGCNGCQGGGGGGGMAAPLTNPVWIYGDDDDTLFRLIALGTGKLSPGDAFGKLGYRRKPYHARSARRFSLTDRQGVSTGGVELMNMWISSLCFEVPVLE